MESFSGSFVNKSLKTGIAGLRIFTVSIASIWGSIGGWRDKALFFMPGREGKGVSFQQLIINFQPSAFF
jgi:hypothetical protein